MPSPFQWQDPDQPWELPDGSTHRPGDPVEREEEQEGCSDNLIGAVLALGVLGLLMTSCAPDEGFRIAFCGMPALVVGFVVLAWALWR